MTKLISSLLVLLILASTLWLPVYAQPIEFDSEVKVQDVEGIQLQLIQNTQDPGSKHVKFDLVIASQVTSDRVQVRWEVTGKSELVSGGGTTTLRVVPNEIYTVPLVVWPREFGVTNVKAFVEAFQVDGTRVATASQTFGSYEDGEVFPPTDDHNLVKTLFFARTFALIAVAAFIAAVGGMLGWKWFRKWYNDRNT
jgi:hypothetical protein